MNTPERGSGLLRPLAIGAVLLALAFAAVRSPRVRDLWQADRSEELAKLSKAPVRRASFNVLASANGQTESSNRTKIECDVEAINYRTRGVSFSGSGASTILWLIPDGAMVKEGDLLCELDVSEYIEIVRTQSIKVEEEKAEVLQAELDLKVAEMAVTEFLDGTYKQQLQEMDGKIKLAESDVERWADRLMWSERMLEKGYVSQAALMNERMTAMRAKQSLELAKMSRANYVKYTHEKTMAQLRAAVENATVRLTHERKGLERNEERLDHYKQMIEYGTIRAPHDGMVVYASNTSRRRDDRDKIEVGYQVRQRQDLFYLPDLSEMRVTAMIHQTVVEKVRAGMPAKIMIEGLPGLMLEGHVEMVTRLPFLDDFAQDVKNYVSQIKIDTIPEGIKPGMTAQVEILTDQRQDVLAVPSMAVTIEDDREVCYVAHEDGLERREVALGEASRELVEITGGLAEGEEVVLDPTQYGNLMALMIEPEAGDEPTAVAAAN